MACNFICWCGDRVLTLSLSIDTRFIPKYNCNITHIVYHSYLLNRIESFVFTRQNQFIKFKESPWSVDFMKNEGPWLLCQLFTSNVYCDYEARQYHTYLHQIFQEWWDHILIAQWIGVHGYHQAKWEAWKLMNTLWLCFGHLPNFCSCVFCH